MPLDKYKDDTERHIPALKIAYGFKGVLRKKTLVLAKKQ
jgi:hypothetical protein